MSDSLAMDSDAKAHYEQERQHAPRTQALRYARDHYAPEARIVELVEKTTNHGAEPLWHALIALEDGRHAVVGVRRADGDDDTNDDANGRPGDEAGGGWDAFEVSQPALGDV